MKWKLSPNQNEVKKKLITKSTWYTNAVILNITIYTS